MKKYLFILAAAATILAACAKETEFETPELPIDAPENGFVCSFAINDPQTKTTIAEDSGKEKYNIFWEEGDEITVNNGKTNMVFVADQKGATATFKAKTGISESDVKNFFKATSFTATYGDTTATAFKVSEGNAKHIPMSAPSITERTFTFSATKPVLAVKIPAGVTANALKVAIRDGADVATISKADGSDAITTFYIPVPKKTAQYNIHAYTAASVGQQYEIAESMKMQTSGTFKVGEIYPFEFAPTREITEADEQTLYQYPATYNVRIKKSIENQSGTAVTVKAPDSNYPAIINISAKNYTGVQNYSVGQLAIDAPNSHVDIEHGTSVNVTSKTSKNTFVIKPTFTISEKLTVTAGSVKAEGQEGGAKNVKEIVLEYPDSDSMQGATISVSEVTTGTPVVITNNTTATGSTPINVVGINNDASSQLGGYSIVENQVQNINKLETAVAKIGETGYYILSEAFEAATTGQTVTLVADNVLNSQAELSGKEITLDLNNHSITYSGSQLNSGLLLVHNGAGLTITGSGNITSGDKAYAAVALTKKGDDSSKPAKLTINGGTLTGNYYGITGNGSRQNTVINITGGTVTATASDGTGIFNPQNGTINISGGTITAATGIYMKSGSVASFTGGTIQATGAKGQYQYQGDGYQSTGDAIVVDNCNYPGGRPSVTVKGGTLSSANGFQIGAYYHTPETDISDIYSSVNTLTAPAGYVWNTTQTQGTYKLEKVAGVAAIGTTSYDTLAAAFEAVSDGQTITVMSDNTSYGCITVPEGKNVILDLNGKTVKTVEDDKGKWSVINGGLTVIGGGYLGDDTHNKTGYIFYVYGTLTLDSDAKFESGLEVAESRSATSKVYIKKGYYVGDVYDNRYWTFNKIDSVKDGALIEVTGGTFENFNPAESQTEYPYENWVKSGYVAVAQGTSPETWVVQEGVAKIGTKGYASFESAWSAVQTGETITLLDNVALTNALTASNKVVTIDMNGKTMSSSASFFVNLYSTVEIHFTGAGAVSATGDFRLYDKNAVLSFDNTFTGTINYNSVVRGSSSSKGTLKLYGGYFKPKTGYSEDTYNTFIPEGCFIESITEGTYAGYKKATEITAENANFQVGEKFFVDALKAVTEWNTADENILKVLKDVNVTSTVMTANPGSGKTLTLNLNGKKLYSTNYNNIMNISSGKLIVTGNGTLETVSGSYSLEAKNSSTLEIQNGTFNTWIKASSGSELSIADGTFNGDISPATTTVITTGTFKGSMTIYSGKTVTINGGTFQGNGEGQESIISPYGTLNVNGGNIEWITGQTGGVINITGGHIGTINRNGAIWNITGGTIDNDEK